MSYEIGAIDLHRLTGDKFSKFRPGEIVRVVDEADGINLRTRIVRVEKADAEGAPGTGTAGYSGQYFRLAEPRPHFRDIRTGRDQPTNL